ncbi:MAG: helix-turn-helix transcriptional regulator [Clostridia bacterium]|nr:helix-turn-helix transcriptional regulator [Clostridia bacterium]
MNSYTNTFNSNLKFLLKKNFLTQKDLSELTNTSCATINNYINKNAEPSIKFLISLKEKFGINIDEFLTKDLTSYTPVIQANNANLDRFVGTYIMYFYNSGEYKGKVSSFSKNTLKYGVVTIVKDETNSKLISYANFIKNRDDAEEFKRLLDQEKNPQNKYNIHSNEKEFYTGTLELSATQIFIYLKSDLLNDQCLMIFNNPPSNKNYLGGLGTANSVSRGREHMPCIQYIILAKNILQAPDGEIYNLLSLGVSDINVEIEAEQLLNLFKNLYIKNDNLKEDLNPIQKRKIIENALNSILVDLIDANMFRFAKVSNMEDDDYYRIIKDE